MSAKTLASSSDDQSSVWKRGQVIARKLELVREIGRGGMGAVWEAKHRALGSSVAVKLIEPDAAESTIGVARFVREAKASATLRSPHVVQTLDHGIDRGAPYIVMEMLVGESLDDRLERVGRLSNAQLAVTITHIARALTKAKDAGIIHRDLKPANVFIVENDDEEIVKVLDFGIAKLNVAAQEQDTETKTGTVVGTPQYMSPEQARGKKVDWRSDLWSLAIIAYECHTGRVPFKGPALGELILQICTQDMPVPSEVTDVAEGFDEWFSRAAGRDREDRFQDAKEMAKALRRLLLREGATDPAELSPEERKPPPALTTESSLDTRTDLGSTIREPAAPAWRLPAVAIGALVIAAGAYFLATSSGESTAASASASASADLRQASVAIDPPQARVSVAGEFFELNSGTLVIEGALGSVHEVTVEHEGRAKKVNVVISELGATPSKIAIEAASAPAATTEPKSTAEPVARKTSRIVRRPRYPKGRPPPGPSGQPKPATKPEPQPAPKPEPKPGGPKMKGEFE